MKQESRKKRIQASSLKMRWEESSASPTISAEHGRLVAIIANNLRVFNANFYRAWKNLSKKHSYMLI